MLDEGKTDSEPNSQASTASTVSTDIGDSQESNASEGEPHVPLQRGYAVYKPARLIGGFGVVRRASQTNGGEEKITRRMTI